MSAVTEDLRLLSRTWEGTISGIRVVAFLRYIVRHVPGKVLVVWDGAPIHRCHQGKQLLAAGAAKRLKLQPLPGYAPELKPAEGVWRWRKRVALGNGWCETLAELRYEIGLAVARLRHRKAVIEACIHRAGYMQ